MTPFLGGRQFSEAGALQALDATDGVSAGAYFLNGWALNEDGESYVQDLGEDAVPAGAVFINGIALNEDGRLYVTTEVPAATDAGIGGVLVRQDGAMRVTSGAVDAADQFMGGWAVAQTGQARIAVAPWSFSEVLDYYDGRYGITEDVGVAAWAPTLRGSNTLVQATDAAQPAWTDGNSVLFDGSNDAIRASFALSQPYMIFMVFKNVSFTDNEHIFATESGRGVMVQRTTAPNLALFQTAYSNSVAGAATGTYMIGWALFDGADSLIGVNLGTPATGASITGEAGSGLCIGSVWTMDNLFANVQLKAAARTSEMDATRRAELIRAMNAQYGVF